MRQASGWIIRKPVNLDHDEQCLSDWIEQAEAAELAPLHEFARGLRQDYDAVAARISLLWNSGPVEGHVNRIKMIKRQQFGRAGFFLATQANTAHAMTAAAAATSRLVDHAIRDRTVGIPQWRPLGGELSGRRWPLCVAE